MNRTFNETSLRILVQGGSYELDNLGDVSMLEALVERITSAQPEARIALFSRNATQARRILPDIELLPVEGKRQWRLVHDGYLQLRRALPIVDTSFRFLLPRIYEKLLHIKARQLVNRQEIQSADLLLLSGGGYITDVFPGQAWSALERLDAAVNEGIPFALFGQGIGPLRDRSLIAAARRILPRAKMIAVREKLVSVPLLEELGVRSERIVVTGDDSVEAAYRARKVELGNFVGVNFRVAGYTGMTTSDVDAIRPPLHRAVKRIGSELKALPVCIVDSVESASDATIAARLLGSADGHNVPGTSEELIGSVGACRMIVTGSYHAGVFALSQGIPAVCVFNCEYYEVKFRGLAAQFGTGCVVLDKSSDDFDARLVDAVSDAWENAERWRPALLDAAQGQVDAARQAYDHLWEITDRRAGAPALSAITE
ncbi:MAG: polysaccharide pyruvyl transferase family protein [Gemmatimonadaceae bacterium]